TGYLRATGYGLRRAAARTGTPVLTLKRFDVRTLKTSDLRYKTPENLEGRPRRVEHRGTSRDSKRVVGSSDKNIRGRDIIVTNKSIKHGHKSEVQRRAQAKKDLDREHAFDCRVRSIMQTNIRADVRDTVELIEHGRLFSGNYLVDTVEHSF